MDPKKISLGIAQAKKMLGKGIEVEVIINMSYGTSQNIISTPENFEKFQKENKGKHGYIFQKGDYYGKISDGYGDGFGLGTGTGWGFKKQKQVRL